MKKRIFELRYMTMPGFLYKENRLSLTAMKVYLFVHAYTNPFYFSNEHLAEMFGCHPQTISTAMTQLEEFGYIKTEYEIRAGGGKIRLSVDAHSDGAISLSRKPKKRAPTERNHSDKDIKVNNIKENFLKDILENRKQKSFKRNSVLKNYSASTRQYNEKKVKQGTDARGII